MKIHSPFKDYYDCMLRTNHSEFPVYIRTPKEVKEKSRYGNTFSMPDKFTGGSVGYGGVILFCGKYYPFIESQGTYFYSFMKLESHFQSLLKEESFEAWKKGQYFDNVSRPDKFKEWFLLMYSSWRKDPEDLVPEYKAYFAPHISPQDPIASFENTLQGYEITINPNLSKFQFYNVFDPQETFLILERHLQNIAVPLNPIQEIKDKDLLVAKGFDKFSFRKQPTKNKKRSK